MYDCTVTALYHAGSSTFLRYIACYDYSNKNRYLTHKLPLFSFLYYSMIQVAIAGGKVTPRSAHHEVRGNQWSIPSFFTKRQRLQNFPGGANYHYPGQLRHYSTCYQPSTIWLLLHSSMFFSWWLFLTKWTAVFVHNLPFFAILASKFSAAF